jgi:hypothetical protein
MLNIKSEPIWNQNPITISAAPHHNLAADLNEYLHQKAHGASLQQYLKFNAAPPNIKKEIFEEINSSCTNDGSDSINNDNENENITVDDTNQNDTSISEEPHRDESNNELESSINGKIKKKRKTKKKPPKPKRPKPGQVHIATALDGTILFCCPECQMAYPEKESLEQHLVVHKIDRRYSLVIDN